MMYEEFIGAIKIKDGLFIGDEQSVKDLEFIITNKVTHIINTAGKQIDNMLENLGISYLTFYCIETVNQIVDFIEEANARGESCLVHSVRGQSRACCVLTAYFMRKYQWTLLKTLDYLNSRRPDLEIRATFFDQLKSLEQYLQQTGQGAISADWNQSGNGPDAKIQVENSPEEQLLRNTYINSKQGQIPDYYLNIGKPQRFGGYSPYKKPVPTRIVWQDEVSNNKKKLVQVLNQSQQPGKKGASVQHRKPSPAPFKRAQQQSLKQMEQQPNGETQKLSPDFYDSILKGSNKTFRKATGEEVADNEINQAKQQSNGSQNTFLNNFIPQNVQRSNENSASKPPQNPTSNSLNKLNSNRALPESDTENNNENIMYKSLTNKENSSRPGSTRDDSLLQEKNGNEFPQQQQQQKAKQEGQPVKLGVGRNREVNNSQQQQSLNNQIYNNSSISNNNSQVRADNVQQQQNLQNNNVKNKFNNDNISKVSNINGNIINLTVNNFVNATVGTGNTTQQGFQIANAATSGVIGNASQIPINYDLNVENLAGQPFIVSYPQNGLDYSNLNNGSFAKNNNSGLMIAGNNSQMQAAGKQYKQQYSSDPSKLQNYYKFVEEKKKNQGSDPKQGVQGQQLPMAQQIIFQNQQMLLMQKQQQQQQQLAQSNLQLTQQQQQAQQFNIQQTPLQIMQNQQAAQNGQVSNSQTLSKMLSKNNTYHHSDMAYQKAISKSFNQSKIKQDMVFGSNQYPLPKDMNNYSLIKTDLSDSKITKNMMKQKQQGPSQQQQPAAHKFPIKANPDLFEKRPNSANTSLPQGRQAYNGFVVMTNNFLMGSNSLNNTNNNFNNESENNMLENSNINKRPSSTGGGLRSFSPGAKALKQQNLPNAIKPQLIVTNQNGSKKTGMRYPSPAINSQSQNTYQMSVSQKNKWK